MELTDKELEIISDILYTAANQVDNSFTRGAINGKNNSDKLRELAKKVLRQIGKK